MNVQYFGTCRIFEPLKLLASRGDICLLPGFWGFPHSTKEILQTFDIIDGKLVVPRKHWDGLNYAHLSHPRFEEGTQLTSCLNNVDLVVIEISSIKTYLYQGLYTQINRVSELKSLVVEKSKNTENTKLEFSQLSIPKILGLDTIRADIEKLIERLYGVKVLFVNHFVVEDHNSKAFTIRLEIRELLDSICNEIQNVFRYDPTPLLMSMDMPIRDYAHYKDSFIPHLATDIEVALSSIFEENKIRNDV